MNQNGGFSLPKDKIRILLTEGIHPSAVDTLSEEGYRSVERTKGALDGSQVAERLQGVHLLGIRSGTQITQDVLEAADRLFAIGCFSVGTSQVDLDAAAARGIPVFNAPHSNTRSVAELVLGLAIMMFRDVFRRSNEAHRGAWLKSASGSMEVRGKVMGIVGYGHIGSQVSVLAEALGMKVLFHDVAAKLPLGNAESVATLEDLLHQADLVTLHVPEDPGTNLLMDRGCLETMKQGSYLINASRGSVVDLEALADLLRAGHLAGAAVDVFPEEPKGPSEPLSTPLRGIENVILTPHIGGSTEEAQRNIGVEVARKLAHFSDRGTTLGAVNFPELNMAEHADCHRILHIHKNVPGVLRQINRIFADAGVNILGQHLNTKDDVGYVVLDAAITGADELIPALRDIGGTLRTRILY